MRTPPGSDRRDAAHRPVGLSAPGLVRSHGATGRGGTLSRIVVVTHEFDPFRGGIARVAEGLAAGTAEDGRDPVVLAPDYGEDRTSRDRSRPYRVERFEGRHCSIVSPRQLLRFMGVLRRALPRLEPDLVHAVCPASIMALTLLDRLGMVPAPMAFTVHGTELLRFGNEPLPRLWMRGGFRRAAGVTAVSRAVHEHLVGEFDVSGGRSFVSHPGVADVWRERPAGERASVRSRWGAAPSDFVVLTVARRVPEKGHDRVIEGIGALPPERRERVLYVVLGTGPEEYARTLEGTAARHGVRLRLVGEVPDTGAVEACDAADLFAMLSRRTPKRLEGFGLTYVEAACRGLPSLAVDTGGAAEAVRDGETGVVLGSDAGPADVARALARFQDDERFLRRAGAAAWRWGCSLTDLRHAREVYGRLDALVAGRWD